MEEKETFLKLIKRVYNPSPTDSDDVFEFKCFDPVHGPTLRTTREGVKIAIAGSLLGAVSAAGMVWKYSRMPQVTVLSFGAGAVFGWTFGLVTQHKPGISRASRLSNR